MRFNLLYLALINLAVSESKLLGSTTCKKLVDVCVVGGGPSGITMGRLLKSHNINYQVLEEEDYVGGKTLTWRDSEGRLAETGALFFGLRSTHITGMVKQANLTLKRFNSTVVKLYNQEGTILPYQSEQGQAKVDFLAAVDKYNRLRDGYDLTVGYVNAPPEIHQSLLSWLKVNNMTALVPLFVPIITLQGSGPIDETPALYVLKLLDLKGLTSLHDFIDNLWTVEAGLDVLYSRLAEGLNLKLNSKVKYIKRESDSKFGYTSTLHFSNPLQTPVNCKNVVLAIPPYQSKLQNMFNDMDQKEIDLISKIKYRHFTSSVIEAKGWDFNLMLNSISNQLDYPYEPTGYGETVSYLKQNDYFTSYSWIRGAFSEPPSATDVNRIAKEQVELFPRLRWEDKKLNKTKVKVLQSYVWEYSPYIQSKDVQNGWFKRFDSLQGYKNTYYSSSLLSFETMNESIAFAKHLFQTKIKPKF